MERQIQEDTIDIKELILNYTKYWYYFVLSILFCLFIAFLNNRYTVPEYSVSTTLLIRDDNNTQLGAENLLEGLELFSGKKNLKNEIVILNSYSITEKIIRELGLGLSYFQHGFFQTNEMFENSPFIVHLDSTHNQLIQTKFSVDIIDSLSFNLSVKTEDKFPYNLIEENFDKTILSNINIDQLYNFGDTIKNEYFSFSVHKSLFFNLEKIKKSQKKFSFRLYPTNKLAQQLIRDININPINKETSILKINIKARTPKKYIYILNKLTEIYIRSGLDEKNIMAINTIDFIDEQLDVIQDSLTFIENKLEKFRLENPNLEIVDKEFGTYFQKQKLDNTLSEQSVNIKYYRSLLAYLKDDKNANSIVSPTSMGISNPELNSLINQLLNLYSKEGELRLTTTKKNPIYKSIISQIEHTKKTIIENVTNLIASASIYENALKGRINAFNNKINKLPEAEKNYLILKRKHEANEQTVVYLQQKRYEASLAKAGTESDHKVIDPARLDSETPIKPKKKLSYLLALLAGIIAPICIMSLRSFFSDTIYTPSDIRKATNIPILGLIGHSEKAKNMVITATKSVIAESFRALRTNLQYLSANKKRKIITITSSVGGEGKTFTAMNLAAIFALAGHKTVLVGGDLRKPRLHEDFQQSIGKGLSSFLIGKAKLSEIIEPTEMQCLDLITAGPVPPNPAELLDSEKMKKLISDLHQKYDYVIIDTPPIGLVTDGVILMQNADINLYIIRHDYSTIKSLNIINSLYNDKQVKNVHAVINDFQLSSSYGDIYGYGYGGYGYGYYEEDA